MSSLSAKAKAAFETLARTPIEAGAKGIPPHVCPIPLGDIGKQGWSVLNGDLTLPALTLKKSAVTRNSATMRDYLSRRDVALAPHGKTTLAPQLFALQTEDGAWGITISNVQHLAICRRFDFRRMIMANQVVGPADVKSLFHELAASPDLELYVLIDSLAGVERLVAGLNGIASRLNVLVEMGVPGGRAGCRTIPEALAVAEAAARGGLSVRGVEAFEGILGNAADVDKFLGLVCDAAAAIAKAGHFSPGREIILTAGGSSYYDRVAELLGAHPDLGAPVRVVARSGCYLTHDSGGYQRAFNALRQRDSSMSADAFTPALMVFAYVQTRPDRDKAIVTMGRRDVGTDSSMPLPLVIYRKGRDAQPVAIGEGFTLSGINDQHGHLTLPADADLEVGDIIGFGISHPCTTFDKWQVLFVVDDEYGVVDAIRTFF